MENPSLELLSWILKPQWRNKDSLQGSSSIILAWHSLIWKKKWHAKYIKRKLLSKVQFIVFLSRGKRISVDEKTSGRGRNSLIYTEAGSQSDGLLEFRRHHQEKILVKERSLKVSDPKWCGFGASVQYRWYDRFGVNRRKESSRETLRAKGIENLSGLIDGFNDHELIALDINKSLPIQHHPKIHAK